MRVTLKKALKLRKALEALIAKPEIKTDVEISIFGPSGAAPDDKAILADIEQARVKTRENGEEHANLSRILRDLRIAIVRANVEFGVDEALASEAHIDRQIAALKPIADATETVPVHQIAGEIALALKATKSDDPLSRYRGAQKTVMSGIVDAETKRDAGRAIAALKREKEKFEDARTAANAGRQIEIAEGDAKVLADKGVI